mgnify:CR=1 FL=1
MIRIDSIQYHIQPHAIVGIAFGFGDAAGVDREADGTLCLVRGCALCALPHGISVADAESFFLYVPAPCFDCAGTRVAARRADADSGHCL